MSCGGSVRDLFGVGTASRTARDWTEGGMQVQGLWVKGGGRVRGTTQTEGVQEVSYRKSEWSEKEGTRGRYARLMSGWAGGADSLRN